MRDRPARILYLDSGMELAGGQYSLIEILKFLDTARFLPVVASPPASRMRDRCKELGVRWIPLPFESAHLSSGTESRATTAIRDLWSAVRGVSYIGRTVRTEGIGIVHANNFKAALVGCLAGVAVGRPVVFHDRIHIEHGPLGLLVGLLSRRIVAVSESVGAKHRWPVKSKVRVIPPGIDLERLAPADTSASTGTVCYIGRISEEKDIRALVDSAALVIKQRPGARFVIAGSPFTAADAAYLESLRQRVHLLGLSEAFEFLGYVEDIPALLRTCDLLALPSKKEPLGRVMLEAMATGKPVVAFSIGGPAEVIRNQRNGILVSPGDTRGFADAIVTLLSDGELARRLGSTGRETVEEGFSSQVVAARIMRVYDEILPGGS